MRPAGCAWQPRQTCLLNDENDKLIEEPACKREGARPACSKMADKDREKGRSDAKEREGDRKDKDHHDKKDKKDKGEKSKVCCS